ncbi:TetR/AcrR family transcriptional regulator [Periweissella beninensis]|uniref:TetR/AcrR family transcriptional regulator n=1 Tax=Periweissella beninensis TaxID=504936 RepID=A0ABT0VH04_9LACO|nr:TetR/AcrR family transcriptional regulator [Periweissella beninensis]MBM7544879.1 AcrR family transcriptional regulator [Periweissella beninensis]MCM2437121.1 TetR/AcrR family transcriptional regulator [Periweissella beninensis]MCT4396892.1 TetR/AcrR family transcriptional regulator [Periweissella beninensis]
MNKRTQHTTENIKNALIKLLATKPYANISVSDITDFAEINRTTFYTHFTDKDDLLLFIEQNLVEDYSAALDADYAKIPAEPTIAMAYIHNAAVFEKTILFLASKRDTLLALFSSHGDYRLRPRLGRIFKNRFIAELANHNAKLSGRVPDDYAINGLVSHITNMFIFWLYREDPEDPKVLVKIISESCTLSPLQNLSFDEPYQLL